MTTPLEDIIAAARANPRRIVLTEGEDPRIAAGSLMAAREGLAQLALVGEATRVRDAIFAQGGNPADFEIADPATSLLTRDLAEAYHALRKHKGVDEEKAMKAMLDPLIFAAMLVREGHGHGTIGGAVATTAETVRAALQIIGRAPDSNFVSSFFLMILDQPHHTKQGGIIFADCGLVVEPSAEELAKIAAASAASHARVLGGEAKVAMLSFSTAGSAKHPLVSKVTEATRLLSEADPTLAVVGDIQFDAAFVPEIGAAKYPDAPFQGDANVFVFPNLDAANIGYKIAQRIGGAKAIGPILQGLAKPANDLSRGCSAEDVYHMIAVTAAQA